MTKGELEAKLSRLRSELTLVIGGGRGSTQLLIEYAPGLGTGYEAFAKAKEVIEGLIAQAEKGLAALPKPSKFELAKQEFDDNGDWNNETKNYIKALEACRPWVIKKKSTGSLWVCGSIYAVFLSEGYAKAYYDKIETFESGEYEIVQWEGSE